MSSTDDERTTGGRHPRPQLPLSVLGTVFLVVALTAFALSIESGRPTPYAGGIALVTALLGVAGIAVLDAVVGRTGVRIVAHVLPGLVVLSLAFLLTALQFADRFLTPPLYVVLLGHWVVGFSLVLGGVDVARGATRRVRRVAAVGLGATVVWTLVAAGYVVAELVTRGWNGGSGITAGAVSAWVLVLVLAGGPSLVFLWDRRETRPERQHGVDG
ncbi:hypothetical protein N0B31_14940 [Salinirubellus salinus]|uniref:Uncharacterized protein n=1 Tax=Salinirubellus salinus TaxID=1364945 RepID=A0A9E7U3N0_9EURY|nr:hypothetical protein [Salinirubellus salinus]UWM53430.1 hypothetical protein N0B31_14940 [Salinirubellus salinus]